MAADLHIHIFEGITGDDLAMFFADSLGSKWFDPSRCDSISTREVYGKIGKTPNIWVGQVSWLKADFYGDKETYVPETIADIWNMIGENLPVIDDALIAKIAAAFDKPNKSCYKLNDKKKVLEFLKQHKGKQAFVVSW